MNKIGKMKQGLISAQEITKKYGITYQTLNHYTNLGILQVITKNGNTRLYDDAIVRERLMKIYQLINEGYPLRLIRKKIGEK